MSFASDVQAKTMTTTGTAVNGRSRLQGVYYIATSTADTITFKNGASGETVLALPSPAAAGAHDLLIPDNGILCSDEIYVSFNSANISSVVVLFVGGSAA